MAILSLGACSTPGLHYQARNVAGVPDAAAYRTVSVGYFSGPEGDWYTSAFESMLLNADFDGGPWFIVHNPGAPRGTYGGRYSGHVDIIDVRVDEYTRSEKKCVEWDGLFDCEHRAEVLQACIDVDVDVSVTAKLVDIDDGAIIFQNAYHGRSDEHDCDDVKIISGKYAGKRKRGYGPFGHFHDRFGSPSGYLTHDLVQEALRETLSAIRLDIAPYNSNAKAPLLAEAIDPEVRADPRFAQAIAAAEEGDLDGGCRTWDVLLAAYPAAPGVRHNAGACAEAAGDLPRAQALYAEAVDGMAMFRRDGAAFDTLVAALNRISAVRNSDAQLSNLAGAAERGDNVLINPSLCPDCITLPLESPSMDESASKAAAGPL
ncbi:MAG: hypothetical protein AAF253_07775 [Pseudomonadota bacterium]